MSYDKSVDWFEMFCADKEAIISTMARNMAADLECGYDYFGRAMTEARAELEAYKAAYNAELDKIAEMNPSRVNHYCFIKLLKSGAIA